MGGGQGKRPGERAVNGAGLRGEGLCPHSPSRTLLGVNVLDSGHCSPQGRIAWDKWPCMGSNSASHPPRYQVHIKGTTVSSCWAVFVQNPLPAAHAVLPLTYQPPPAYLLFPLAATLLLSQLACTSLLAPRTRSEHSTLLWPLGPSVNTLSSNFQLDQRELCSAPGWIVGKLARDYFLAIGFYRLKSFLSFQILLVGFLYFLPVQAQAHSHRVVPTSPHIPPRKTCSKMSCGQLGWLPGSKTHQ